MFEALLEDKTQTASGNGQCALRDLWDLW